MNSNRFLFLLRLFLSHADAENKTEASLVLVCCCWLPELLMLKLWLLDLLSFVFHYFFMLHLSILKCWRHLWNIK